MVFARSKGFEFDGVTKLNGLTISNLSGRVRVLPAESKEDA